MSAIVREMVVNGSGLRDYSLLWCSDLIEFMFQVFVAGKEGCEEQVLPSVTQFEG